MPKYLIHFLDEWTDFRYSEFIALLHLFHIDPLTVFPYRLNQKEITTDSNETNEYLSSDRANEEILFSKYIQSLRESKEIEHFMIVFLPNDTLVKQICERAILIKAIYKYWSQSPSLYDTVDNVKQLNPSFVTPYLTNPDQSWSIQVATFGCTMTMEQKQTIRNQFRFLSFQGPVQIKTPDLECWIILDYSRFVLTTPPNSHNLDFNEQNELIQNITKPCYFCHKIANGGMKLELQKYSLKKRLYLGPTSLDDSLAFILTNLGQGMKGMIAYEPFVGTGSIPVALSHHGIFCIGSDIDPRVLRGDMYAGKDASSSSSKQSSKSKQETTTKKRDVMSNFDIYELPRPELVRMDHHLLDRHFHLEHATEGFFDIIVTDPPYGIRAGAKKSGRKECNYQISEEKRDDHIPSTQNYPVEEVMLDLMHTAAKSLALNAFLVYLIPTTYDFTLNDLPTHPCLSLIEVCHQPLSARHGRRAVVMQKTKPLTVEAQQMFEAYKETVLTGQDQGFGQLMHKLEAALSADAFYNDNVVKQMSSCSTKRRQSKEQRKQLREKGVFFPVNNPHRRKKDATNKDDEDDIEGDDNSQITAQDSDNNAA